jgi:hypothetical protein
MAPRPAFPKEADVIETNEPMTTTSEHLEPPESGLVQTAREAGAAAQDRLGDLRDAALSSFDEAKSAATGKVEETKDQAAGEIARTAQGLEAAAAQMEGSPFQQDLLREAADGLKQIAHAVEGKSIGRMAGDLSEFGRQNPVAYLGGAALVGFALARFARASTPAGAGATASFPASRFDTGPVKRWESDKSRMGDRNQFGTELASTEFTGGSDHG